MEYKLTSKYKHSKRLKNGTRRSILTFFINGVKLFEQKVPFDENAEPGTGKWHIDNIYLLNDRLHQTRWSTDWNSTTNSYDKTTRDVTYPVSKKILVSLNIPNDLMIKEDGN
jgi:hypothetical protein